MTGGGPERLLRKPGDPRRVSYLELFFDLAFLLAFNRLSRNVSTHLDASGFLHTLLLAAPLWWVWATTTWSADWYDPGIWTVQVVVGVATVGSLVMAAAVPEAFGRYAWTFAGTYVAVNLARSAVLLIVLRRHPLRRRSLRLAFWFALTGALWIAGAGLPAVRIPLWTVAAVLDYVGARLGWPTPVLGRVRQEDARIVGSHLSERLQQIFLISVGELLLIAGTTYSDAGLGRLRGLAFALSFVNAALLALVYYLPAGRGLGMAIDESEYPATAGQEAVLLHLVLIAGVLSTGVGDELIIAEADRPARVPVVAAVLFGTALFLAARVALSVRTYRRLSLPRLAGVVVVLAATPVAFHLPAPGVIATTDLVLLATTVADQVVEYRARGR